MGMFAVWMKALLKDEASDNLAFGKATALPFLMLVWALGLARGVQLLRAASDVDELLWSLSGIALSLYATYRTGHVVIARAQIQAGANVTQTQVVMNGPQAPDVSAPPPNSSAPTPPKEPIQPPTTDPS